MQADADISSSTRIDAAQSDDLSAIVFELKMELAGLEFYLNDYLLRNFFVFTSQKLLLISAH